MKAKFVKQITVTDPDSNAPVELAVFKHENGGMFALDSSFIEQVLPEGGECFIPDIFEEPDFDGTGFVQITGI